VINLAAWSLALGPATIAGMATARDRRLWLLVGGGVLAAAAANVSGLSNGEVERIWLPFTIWVLPAGAALWTSRRAVRGWLALQALVAVSLTALIATNW
jgi:NaMN:DMB phosphoribosyltransferase